MDTERERLCAEGSLPRDHSGGLGSGDEDGRFVLRSRIGAGGMCEVFSAVDLLRVECGDPRPLVALKRLLPEAAELRPARQALAREFFTLRHVAHPGVVRVFDLHRETWGLCFSMELLEGATAHAASAGRPHGLGRGAMPVAAEIFKTLAHLHGIGVAHGDVKPANIFLGRSGRVVLLDFNVSRAASYPGAAGPLALREVEDVPGVPGVSLLHASPECLEGAPAWPGGDIFSACCCVYELLAGRHPFEMLPAHEAAGKRLRPTRPPHLGPWAWRRLRQGLSFDASRRPSAAKLYSVFKGTGLWASPGPTPGTGKE
jgi:serine/threonine-protein kinase Stk1